MKTESIAPTAIRENYFDGLMNAIIGRPKGSSGHIEMDNYTPQQLERIIEEAKGLRETAQINLSSLGNILAVAAVSGEASNFDVANIGWLTSFLSEITGSATFHESNARYFLKKSSTGSCMP